MKPRLGRSKNDPRYGKGEHTIRMGEEEWIDEAAMRERLLATFNDPAYRPPTLPSVAVELLDLSRRPDVEIAAVVKLLEQDTMLAGRVLQIAQSPVYAGAAKIESLRDALMRLGLKTLRDVVLEVATNLRVFRCSAYAPAMEELQRHSMATAYLSRLVARYTAMADEYAFLCGLLHDVGIAGILLVLGDTKRGQKPPELTMLWPVIDAVHEEAGGIMARLWKLPPELGLVIAHHHRVTIEGHDHPLAATVCLADWLAQELGAGLGAADKDETSIAQLAGRAAAGRADYTSPRTLERAREALGLTDAKLSALRAEAEALLAERFGVTAEGDEEG